MPTSEKQRKAAFAELNRRRKGMTPQMFKDMDAGRLKNYAHEPLHKKGKGGGKRG